MSETRYGKYADAVESSLVDYVLKQPRAAGVLLDVGCEGGRHAQLFAERGWRVIATDVDAHFLSVCRSRIPESHCVLTAPDSRELPAESASVDVVLCIEVGSVIHADWAVGEFARVLKPGGQVVGVCWNRTSWRGFIYHNLPFSRVQGSHPMVGFPIRYTDFRSDAVQQGFHFERERGFAWGPFRRSSDSPWVPFWATFERLSGLQRLVSTSPMVAFVARKDDRHTDGRF